MSTGEPPAPEVDAAKAIAEHRRRRRLSLAELAEASGLSVSHLSRIERGERVPTLGILLQLAAAHGISLSALVGDDADRSTLVHRHSTVMAGRGVTYRSLRSRSDSIGQTVLVDVAPAASTAESRHSGDEWLYVLSGTLHLDVDAESWELASNDSIEFDARRSHTLRGGESGAQVLLISTLVEPGTVPHE